MLRVSVVRAILKARVSARALERSNPNPTAPPTPSAVAFKKVRRRIELPPGCTRMCARRLPGLYTPVKSARV